jgi:hypothetical protein
MHHLLAWGMRYERSGLRLSARLRLSAGLRFNKLFIFLLGCMAWCRGDPLDPLPPCFFSFLPFW